MLFRLIYYSFIALFIVVSLCNAEKKLQIHNLTLSISLDNKQNIVKDKWISYDKAKHVTASFICTVFIGQICTHSFNESVSNSKYISGGSVFTLGLVKEFSDSRKVKNYFSWKDVGANAVGILFGLIILNVK